MERKKLHTKQSYIDYLQNKINQEKLTDFDLAVYIFSGYILKILDEVKKETKDV